MSSSKEVVIIGAGVAGCSVAYHLAKRGIKALIVDRESIGTRASGKAVGYCPHHAANFLLEFVEGKFYSMPVEETGGVAPFQDLYRSGWFRMHDIALDIKEKSGIDVEYSESPWITLAASDEEEELTKFAAAFLNERGYPGYEWLDEKALKTIYPDINPKIRGGISMPFYQVEAYKYTLGLAMTAENRGAEFKHGNVVGFGTEGDRITSVKLSTGREIEADAVVLAMGPWLREAASWEGKESGIVVAREQCMSLKVSQKFPLCALSTDDVLIAPKLNGEVLIGISGGKDLASGMEYVPDEKEFKERIEAAVDLLPMLADAEIVEKRGDLEGWGPAPAHLKPVLGPLPEWDNAYMVGQFGTVGIGISAGAGKVMADLIAGDVHSPSPAHSMIEHLSPR